MNNKKGGKPQTQALKSAHTMIVMSEQQARRMAAGRRESHPSDYKAPNGLTALRDARRAIEDRNIERELNLL